MKFFLITSFCFVFSHVAFGQMEEESAIHAVLEAETQDYLLKPIQEIWKNYWILDDKTTLFLHTPDGATNIFDKNALLELPNIVTGDERAKIEQSNFNFQFFGDMAVVSYESKIVIQEESITVLSLEMRQMKKVNGKWLNHIATIIQNITQ